jgi:hypothetical protein
LAEKYSAATTDKRCTTPNVRKGTIRNFLRGNILPCNQHFYEKQHVLAVLPALKKKISKTKYHKSYSFWENVFIPENP